MIMNCYEKLANAIIERAVEDYINQARKLHYLKTHEVDVIQKIVEQESKKVKPIFYTGTELRAEYKRKVAQAKYKLLDIERFFGSGWYGVLTKVDGKDLLNRVKQKIKEDYNIDCDSL